MPERVYLVLNLVLPLFIIVGPLLQLKLNQLGWCFWVPILILLRFIRSNAIGVTSFPAALE